MTLTPLMSGTESVLLLTRCLDCGFPPDLTKPWTAFVLAVEAVALLLGFLENLATFIGSVFDLTCLTTGVVEI